MDAERWRRAKDLFDKALDVPEAERDALFEAECADDSELREEVLELLREDARDDSLLEERVASWAREVLEPPAPPAFQTIGPYRVLRVLGHGGMGVVYLAEQLGRRVAIKMLTDASLSPARRERFEREQHLLAQLTHPSIARLYEASMLADGTPYFVMEYVEGMSITDYCVTNASTIAHRVALFREVCEAVQYAHREAVIHRDLKPSNILVSAQGKVSLLDFGIAKQIESLDRPVVRTQTGHHMMTLAYAAPEQLCGTAVGVYTDVYALGVIFYELLTGAQCFDLSDRSPTQVVELILHGNSQMPSRAAADISNLAEQRRIGRAQWADLDLICLTAMHKDPDRRYSSVEALIRDLDHYRNIEPLEASPDRLGYRLRKFIRRKGGAVAGTALALGAILTVATFYTLRLAQERTLAQAEAAKAKEVSEYAIGLFDAADPLGENADTLDVRTLLDRGVERAESLSAQPQVQAQMLNVLGRVYANLSQYEEAQKLLQQALVIRRRDTDHPLDLAETLANIGVLYRYDSKYESAEKFTREALTIRERQLSATHPDLAASLDNLGVVLSNQGRYEDATAALQRALQILRKNYSQPHPMLDHTLNNLAVNEFNQGHYDEAEGHYREALAVAKATYGPDHAYTAVDLANLGVLLETKGRFAEADVVLSDALRITQHRLGDFHYETAFRMTQLGGMLRRKGDLDRAEAYLRKSAEIERRVLEPNHRNHAVTLNHLALTLQAKQQYEQAEPFLREAVEVFQQRLGPKHEFTATVTCSLGFLLHLRGKNAEAEQLLRQGLQTLSATLPAGHDMIALNESRYGVLLTALSRYEEAERLLLHSYGVLLETFGERHADTVETAGRLAALYVAWEKPAQAAAIRNKSAATSP